MDQRKFNRHLALCTILMVVGLAGFFASGALLNIFGNKIDFFAPKTIFFHSWLCLAAFGFSYLGRCFRRGLIFAIAFFILLLLAFTIGNLSGN